MRAHLLTGTLTLVMLAVGCSDGDDMPRDAMTPDGNGTVDGGGDDAGSDGAAGSCEPQTFTVEADATTTADYTFVGIGPDPDLTLCRGVTYTFEIDVDPVHPFWIKDSMEGDIGPDNGFEDGVGGDGNGTTTGTVTFEVPETAPDELYYQCQTHINMTGTLTIIDAP